MPSGIVASVSATTAATTATAALAAGIEHLHVKDYDLGRIALLAALVVPRAGLQLAFDIDLAALFEVLLGHLGLPTPEHEPMPLGSLLALPCIAVIPAFRSRQAEIGYGHSVRRVAYFGIAAQIADQNYFVYSTGHYSLLFAGVSQSRAHP